MAPQAPLASLTAARFAGQQAFRQAVRDMLSHAAAQGWRQLVLSDPDFADWPLGEAAVVASLNAWAGKGRSMTLLAGNYGQVLAQHARFVAWRRTWDHLLQCRVAPRSGLVSTDVPSAIWTPDWLLHRTALDEHTAGLCTQDRARSLGLRTRLDDCLARSGPGFSASVLGL